MCDVTTAVLGSIAVLSSAFSYASSQEQASQYNAYQDAVADANQRAQEENAKRANDEAIANYDALNSEFVQNERRELTEMERDIMEARARASTALASSEGAGMNVAQLLDDYDRQANTLKSIREQSIQNLQSNFDMQSESIHRTAQGRANAVGDYIPQYTQGQSLLGTVASTAGSVAGTYFKYKDNTTSGLKDGYENGGTKNYDKVTINTRGH